MPVALSASADEFPPFGGERGTPSAEMFEDEARRCVVCDCRYPSFGFGPPLSQKGTLWACGEHRHEVNRQLTTTGLFKRAPTVALNPAQLIPGEPSRREPAPHETVDSQFSLF